MPRSPSRSGPVGLWAADRLLGDRLGPRHGVRTPDERPDRANVDGVRRGRRRRLGVRRRSLRPVPPGPSRAVGDGDVGRISIVAENGIMQRRTLDTVRSRTMAAMEAVLSLGLAAAYLAAGPMLGLVGPQTIYVIAGVFAVGATVVLLRSSACGPTRSATRPRTRCPATDYRGPGDCVILALDGGGRRAHGGGGSRWRGASPWPGAGAAFAALAYIVYRLTGESAVWLSITLLLTMGVQGLVQPLASWLGDRFDRRRVLVALDLAAAAGFVALAFARTPGQLGDGVRDRDPPVAPSGRWPRRRSPTSSTRSTYRGRTGRWRSVGTSGASSGRSSAPSSWRSSPVTGVARRAARRGCVRVRHQRGDASWSRPG